METEILNENSKALIILRKKSVADEIYQEDDPKCNCKSDPVFNAHKPDIFRTRFNKLKMESFSDVVGTVTFVLFNSLFF